MKNIHILPTPQPTWLHKSILTGILRKSSSCIDDMKQAQGMNIYITSDEEIKQGDYGLSKLNEIINFHNGYDYRYYKKIILTTDQDLIKDCVQAIDDEFLEWFIKNPSYEKVELDIETELDAYYRNGIGGARNIKIIIPKEEPKTAWVGVLHDKLNEYYPAKYELKDIYQGEGCLPNFPNEELCQIWCDSKYKVEPKQEQKQHLIDMMNDDEDLGLYNETFDEYLIRLKDRRTEDNYNYYTDEELELYNEYIMDCWRCGMSVYKCLEFMYFAEKEIKVEDVFNDEKREGVKQFISEHKQLENDWEEILFDFIDFYPCILPNELFEWLEENYEIPKKKKL